jgi:hypothetical protein
MSTYSADRPVTGFGDPLNGGHGNYYRGLVPRELWVTCYGPKLWIRPLPSSGKWLGNHTPYTKYGLTTPG